MQVIRPNIHKIQKKLLVLKGRVVNRHQILYSYSSNRRPTCEQVDLAMQSLAEDGFGIIKNKFFYKNPDMSDERLAKYNLNHRAYMHFFESDTTTYTGKIKYSLLIDDHKQIFGY